MVMPSLGKLVKIDLRTAWMSEAGDFTPWLAKEENLALLGETIGLELELEGQEKQVGPFRADILCKDTANDTWVLIENQLEKTDHSHLGQLLTYAAGLGAVTIVWIAERITPEHRAALDWLNEITDEAVNFFGLEIELWRIGDSDLAPKFNVLCQPNDWSRTVRESARNPEELTDTRQLQFEFWTTFKEYVAEHPADFRLQKPPAHHWTNIAIGRAGFQLGAIASLWDSEKEVWAGEIRAEMTIYCKDAKAYYALLEEQKEAIEKELGEPLIWHNPENKRASRAYIRKAVDLNNRQDWPNQHAWLREKLQKLHKVFSPRIKRLNLDDAQVVTEGD